MWKPSNVKRGVIIFIQVTRRPVTSRNLCCFYLVSLLQASDITSSQSFVALSCSRMMAHPFRFLNLSVQLEYYPLELSSLIIITLL